MNACLNCAAGKYIDVPGSVYCQENGSWTGVAGRYIGATFAPYDFRDGNSEDLVIWVDGGATGHCTAAN
eukprot:SAG22_NODE_10062_length_555_cov_0.826754_1_plen_68_part_01